MKRLLTALLSATLLATFFAGTPAPTFAAATEDYYIGYDDGPGGTGCGSPDFEVYNGNNDNSGDRLEDNLQAALNVVDDGDTIIICSGWYSLHGDMGKWDGNQGGDVDPVDPISITIRGSGDASDTVIDGYRADYYWDGDSGEYVYDRYNAFNFENTHLTVTDLTFTKTAADSVTPFSGSAIAVSGGSLVVENVNFNSYDTATDGGAIAAWDAEVSISDSNFDQTTGFYSVVNEDGGAVWIDHNDSTPKTVSITGTSFNGNSSNGKGGAVWAYCVDATITDSEFYDNSTGARGGALYVESDGDCTGELDVVESTFEGNSVDGNYGGVAKWRHMGGAIYSVGQDMTVTNSNFGASMEGNRATNGGAIAMFDRTTGVAALTVTGTDFEDNYSAGRGGAIWLACVDATITGDSEGTWDSYLDGSSSTFWSNGAESGGAIYLYGDGYDDNECPGGTQGSLTVEGVVFDDNTAYYQGGAIHTQQTDVALEYIDISHSVFYSNEADSNGGALNTDNVDLTIDHSLFLSNYTNSDGGAMEVTGSDWDLEITSSEFTDNQSWEEGGGAIKNSGMWGMTVSDTLFQGNGADEDGGAILRYAGSYDTDLISNSDFFDNSTGEDNDGGAIYTDQSTGISNSTFDDNTTGIDGEGGAIYATAFLTVTGSSFDSNYSSYHGGAIRASGGDGLTVTNSTFTNNESRWENGGAIQADLDGEDCPTNTCIAVRNSIFRYNEAENGGAIGAQESISIVGSIFEYNDSSDDGGAVNIEYQVGLIQSSTFKSNRAAWGNGGAVDYCTYLSRHSMLTVQNSTFHDNSAGFQNNGGDGDSEGGAINTCNSDSDLTVSRSTFTENMVSGNGGAIEVEGNFKASGNVFSRNFAVDGDGGAIHTQDSAVIESNTIRHNIATWTGGGVFMEDVDQASVFSRNLVDANTADWGGGIYIVGIEQGSSRMAIHTNSFWNNIAKYDGGGLLINFIPAGALYELANNMKSNIFVKNRANYGAAGVNYTSSVTKMNQRIFTALVKSSKYQLNKSTIRGADKLMLKVDGPK